MTNIESEGDRDYSSELRLQNYMLIDEIVKARNLIENSETWIMLPLRVAKCDAITKPVPMDLTSLAYSFSGCIAPPLNQRPQCGCHRPKRDF